MESAYDVVVVGSGFGGGVTACRMAEQGMRVCVLERGRRFGPGRLSRSARAGPAGLLAPVAEPGRHARPAADEGPVGDHRGRGRWRVARLRQRAAPGARRRVRAAALAGGDQRPPSCDPYYDRTEEALDPHETPADARASEDPRLRLDGRDRAAARPSRLPLAVHFGESRRHPFSGVFQQGCQNLGPLRSGLPGRWPRTRSTSHTSRGPRRTARRSSRCARCSASIRRAAPAGAGGSASAISSTGSAARSRRRCSCSPPARSARAACCSRTAAG